MTPRDYLGFLELVLAAAAVIWFFYGPWQEMLTDIARYRLFAARDRLFMHAARGGIFVDSEEHRLLRNHFNGMIRFCHVLTMQKVVARILTLRPDHVHTDISAIIARIKDEDTRRQIEGDWREAMRVLSICIVLRSLTLIALSILGNPFFLLSYLLAGSKLRAFESSLKTAIQKDIETEMRTPIPA